MPSQAERVEEFVPEDLELQLAYQLLSTEDGISRKVLYELIGQPKRYSELKTVLPEGKSENSLTVALKTLRRNGLVDQRTDAREKPVVQRYELTPLGIQVVIAIQRIQPLQEQIEILRRAILGDLEASSDAAGIDGKTTLSQAEASQSDRNVWHVVPHPDEGWRVKREGATRASGIYETKEEAVQAARELAVKRPEGRVALHRKDGSFQRQVAPSRAAT